jgi:hypothetical protein
MFRFAICCLLAAAGVAAVAAGGRADAPVAGPLPLPAPGPVVPLDGPPVVVTPSPVPACPLSLCDFAATFKPAPGSYEVWLIHPKKGCPVKVCFTLPCGCPHVRVCKRDLIFDYGKQQVKIHFLLLCAKATVSYR